MVGWMDHGLRRQKGNIFIYFFLVNTLFVCHVMSLGLPVVRRPEYAGVANRQQTCVDRNAGANMW